MDKLEAIEKLVMEMKADADNLFNRNVKSAAPKLRGKCQELKGLVQEVRIAALDHKNSIPVKKKTGSAGQ